MADLLCTLVAPTLSRTDFCHKVSDSIEKLARSVDFNRIVSVQIALFMPSPSIFTRIMAVMCAGLPELGLLGKKI